MEFKNRKSIAYKVGNKKIYASRSVAVVGVIIIYKNLIPHVLVSRRGPNAEDFQGKMNLVAGYLDWDETGLDGLIRETWEEVGFNLREYVDKGDMICSSLSQPWSVNSTPTENNQNVSLRYGAVFQINPEDKFPTLTTEYNEVVGECEDPMWLSLEDIYNYEWAFNHDQVIGDYYKYININFPIRSSHSNG
jgi:8-oxo-dGTP pyrophosphatase MutT (NUDIX family)